MFKNPTAAAITPNMVSLLGEYECKLDSKSRISLPSGLKRQLPPEARNRFVINRGLEQHLTLFPFPEWERVSAEVNRLNLYVKKNRDFVRYFHRGATELKLDSAGRILLPKRLMEYAAIQEEVILSAFGQRIEVWAKGLYDDALSNAPDDYAELAEEIMGRSDDASSSD